MASGDTLLVFTPEANDPPASGYAVPDTRNAIGVLDFDADADEAAVFKGVMPRSYAGGGLTVRIHWMASSATSGAVRWGAQFERSNTDLDSDSFAAAKTAGTTTNGTSGILNVTEIAFADGAEIDSLAAGEPFRLKVYRDADGTSGTDDMTGDAELFAIEIKET